MRRVDSLEKTLMLGGIGGKRRRGRQRMRWLDGITDSMGVSLSLEAAQGAPRDPRRDSRGERSPWLPLETKLQYFGHLVSSVDSLEKSLMLGGIGCRRLLLGMCFFSRGLLQDLC